jgi:hypothetical protein
VAVRSPPRRTHLPTRTKTETDIQFYHRHRIKNARLANHVAQADGKYGVLFRRATSVHQKTKHNAVDDN